MKKFYPNILSQIKFLVFAVAVIVCLILWFIFHNDTVETVQALFCLTIICALFCITYGIDASMSVQFTETSIIFKKNLFCKGMVIAVERIDNVYLSFGIETVGNRIGGYINVIKIFTKKSNSCYKAYLSLALLQKILEVVSPDKIKIKVKHIDKKFAKVLFDANLHLTNQEKTILKDKL